MALETDRRSAPISESEMAANVWRRACTVQRPIGSALESLIASLARATARVSAWFAYWSATDAPGFLGLGSSQALARRG